MSKGNNKTRFTRSDPQSVVELITVNFEGHALQVPGGVTVAAALLGHDDDHFCLSAADHDRRAPYCLMGVCFECLVEIDGLRNRQACLEPVYEGMNVTRQNRVVEEETANEK